MVKLKVRKIGNSLGVILPKDIVSTLDVSEGDELYATTASDGVSLQKGDAEFDAAMKAFERGRKKFRNALRELAK